MKKQYVKIQLEEYKYLLEVLGEYKLLSYAYQLLQPEEQVKKKELIGFKTKEETE